MSDQAVITGTFSEAKFIKTRSAMQIVIEVPIEYADQALERLGGVPQPGKEVHVAVARLNTRATPRAKGGRLARQAGILCDDVVFTTFLDEKYGHLFSEGDSAAIVRGLCCVASRANLDSDPAAGERWRDLVGEFEAWKTL